MGFKTGSRDVSSKSIEDLIKYNPNSSIVESRLKTRTSTDSNVKMIPSNNTVVKSNKLNAYDIVVQLDKIKNDSIVVIKQLEHTNNVAKEAELVRESNEAKRQTLFGQMNTLKVSLDTLKIDTESARDSANVAADRATESSNIADTSSLGAVKATNACVIATNECINATKDANSSSLLATDAADKADTAAENANTEGNLANAATRNANAATEGANAATDNANAKITEMTNLGTQLRQAEQGRVVAEQGREAAEVIRERKIAEMDKTYATKVELKALEDIVIQGADAYWYGCESPIGQAGPDMTRIGYMDNHRALPYHNRIRPCVVNDDRTINYFLDNNDIRLKADGTVAVLDGTDGQLMVYYPAGYHILNRGLTKEVWAVGLSPFSYDGIAAEYVPAFIVSMDYATVQRTGNKLACVINEDADYAGSGSGATAGGLGYPRTAVSNYNYTLYARNRGAEWVNSFAFFELIKTSLMYIEYSTHYLQKPFNLALTSQGYKQGGLGEGAWNWSSTNWSAYNGYYPVIKIGEVQLDLSQSASTNGTGVYTRVFQIGETQYTTKFPCWRWCSNLYAHLWRWDAGVDIDIHPDTSGTPISAVYMTKNPSEVLATNYNDFSFIELYDKIGELPRVGSYSKEFHKGSAYQKIGSAGSNTYMCAYFWTTIGAGRERRGFLSGGNLYGGGPALRASASSNSRPSSTNANFGSGLSAYIKE